MLWWLRGKRRKGDVKNAEFLGGEVGPSKRIVTNPEIEVVQTCETTGKGLQTKRAFVVKLFVKRPATLETQDDNNR